MSTKNLERRAFLTLVVLTSAVFFWMVRGYLMPVFWAVVFAVLFRPVFQLTLRWTRGRNSISSLLTTLVVIVVIMVPLGLLVAAVTAQALDLYEGITLGTVDLQAPVVFLEQSIPTLSGLLAEFGIDAARIHAFLESAVVTTSQFMATQALAVGQGLLRFTALFGLMLYFLFFFVRDWEKILSAIVRALPLGGNREQRLFAKFAEVSRATIKGSVVIAVVQGAIGGVLFAIVGLDAALFWGVMMAALSLLPIVGTALVWVPASIMLIAGGAVGKGLVLIIGGVLVIGLVDNVLRPILVGNETKMPDYMVLLSTLGGLTMFGASGVIIGPFVAALFLVLWEMMAEEHAGKRPMPMAAQALIEPGSAAPDAGMTDSVKSNSES